MNTIEFITELKSLIEKFDKDQGVVLTDIKLERCILTAGDGSKHGITENITLTVE